MSFFHFSDLRAVCCELERFLFGLGECWSAEYCNFGGTLDDMLRDQLVWGIKNDAIQQIKLGEAKLTFTHALELAQGLETAA